MQQNSYNYEYYVARVYSSSKEEDTIYLLFTVDVVIVIFSALLQLLLYRLIILVIIAILFISPLALQLVCGTDVAVERALTLRSLPRLELAALVESR